MKKIFVIIVAICLMVSVFSVTSVTSFAEEALLEPAAGVVLRITAIKGNDTVLVGDHKNFEDGWNAAMDLANDMDDYDYERVIVDIYTDWVAKHGNFTDDEGWEINGPGFSNDTIYFNDDVKMTLNMNGHTIDRGLSGCIRSGEVIYVDADADVIINDGTITGGASFNGAGGIHINSGAKVTLNDVNVVSNISWEDDGAGIALYNDASLIMNGGSLKDNELWHDTLSCYGAAIYADESFVSLNNVEIKNNQTLYANDYGAAIYADESTVVINGCKIDGNGIKDEKNKIFASASIIHAIESSITIKNTSFTNNGYLHYVNQGYNTYTDVSTLIYLKASNLVMEGCGISQNTLGYLIHATNDSGFFVSGTNMSHNTAIVLKSSGHMIDSYFNGCTFANNISSTHTYTVEQYPFLKHTFTFSSPITFYNCNMGNSTYSNPASAKFINQNVDSGVVLTISGRKTDGNVVKIEEHRSFETGWAAAMELATNSYWMSINAYEYVVVDMHVDWIASNGRFTNAMINGIGFNSDTIYVSEDACLMLNMNGYKIDRGLTEAEANGEVMYIASGAEVVINNGTITGGFSNNGAGGIHISGDAKVTLNNVQVEGNKVKGDAGAGIAAYGGATLNVNGGSISSNILQRGYSSGSEYGAGIYVEDGTVALNNVTLKNNGCGGDKAGMIYGSAIYSTDSNVMLKGCTVEGNGVTKDKAIYFCNSTICAKDSTLVIENTSFIGNGAKHGWQSAEYKPYKGSAVISVDGADLSITGGKFTGNNQVFLFSIWDTVINVDGVDFTGNNSLVMYVRDASSNEGVFANCKFSAGSTYDEFKHDFQFKDKKANIKFVDCDFGNATFNNKNAVTFVGGTVSNSVGSIFGEGSLAMIVSFVALIASVAAIVVNVSSKKNKVSDPQTATEDDK